MKREYFEHVVDPGERWDLIAWKYYGDAARLKPLLRANPELVGDPDRPAPLVLAAGVIVRVPVLEAESQTRLPPWKR